MSSDILYKVFGEKSLYKAEMTQKYNVYFLFLNQFLWNFFYHKMGIYLKLQLKNMKQEMSPTIPSLILLSQTAFFSFIL